MVDEDAQSSESERDEAERDRITRRYGSLISMRPLPLTFDRGGLDEEPKHFWSWPGRWRRRLVHMWRYGVYHPDEDLLGVIDAATESLTTQIMAAEATLTGSRLERLQKVKQELRRELADPVPELAVLLGIEAKINALYPPAIQRRRAWMIRERFRRVAPGQAAEYWAAERIDANLEEAQRDGMRKADDAVAGAGARQTAAVTADQQAEAALTAAQAAYDAARALVDGTDEEVAAKLDRLKALREPASDEQAAERGQLQQEIGPLLDARDALDSATAARAAAAAAMDAAIRAVEGARLERNRVLARFELARAEARLRRAQQAALDVQAGAGAAGAQRQVEDARAAVAAAREKLDSAAEKVEAHGGSGGGAPPPTDGAQPQGPAQPAAGEAEAGIPPDADAQTLLGYVHGSYLMGIAREKAVRDLMRWLMMRFWSANLFLVGGLLLLWAIVDTLAVNLERLAGLVIGLFFIAAIGRVGATMSVVQRLQQAVANNILARDPILELTRLRTGKHGINLALFSGGVFALLMYAFIASGIPAMAGLDDGVAPELARVQRNEEEAARVSARADALSQAAQRVTEAQERLATVEQQRDALRNPPPPTGEADAGNATAPAPVAGGPQADAAANAQVEAARDELRRAAEALEAARQRHAEAQEQDRPSTTLAAQASKPQTTQSPEQQPASTQSPEQQPASTQSPQQQPASTQSPQQQPAATQSPQQQAPQRADRRDEALPQSNVERPAPESPREPLAPRTGLFQQLRDTLFGPPTQAPAAASEQSACKATDACDPFFQLSGALGLAERADFFKLLIWAFLAGFAERLVPDVLDTIANRARRRRRRQEEDDDEAGGTPAAPAPTPAPTPAPAPAA